MGPRTPAYGAIDRLCFEPFENGSTLVYCVFAYWYRSTWVIFESCFFSVNPITTSRVPKMKYFIVDMKSSYLKYVHV